MEICNMEANIRRRLEDLAQFTATPGQGCTRLPFTKETRAAADYLKEEMLRDGLEVWEDQAGNLFGRLPGKDPSLPCIMSGSHYDSVYCGGNYDGVGGIVCAMEMARALKETPLERDFVVNAFMDEEGCLFGGGYFGSRTVTGLVDAQYCRNVKDRAGVSVYEMMQAYGLDPERVAQSAWEPGRIGHYLEIHAEQGPVLDAKGLQLGLVDCIVGIQRYMVTIHGQSNHAGTTPMDMRLDAMDRAARVIARVGEMGRAKGPGTVATVGYIEGHPSSYNIIAGRVKFSVELRSTSEEIVDGMAEELRRMLEEETAGGLSYEMELQSKSMPVRLSEEMIAKNQETCRRLGLSHMVISSGAGHDAQIMAAQAEIAMLFVPSRGGMSHCPQEHSEYSDLARATQVALELIRSL